MKEESWWMEYGDHQSLKEKIAACPINVGRRKLVAMY
jgi:hypothetical protein